MANRRVRQTGKDRDHDIIALCGTWGRSSKAEAIAAIETETHFY